MCIEMLWKLKIESILLTNIFPPVGILTLPWYRPAHKWTTLFEMFMGQNHADLILLSWTLLSVILMSKYDWTTVCFHDKISSKIHDNLSPRSE